MTGDTEDLFAMADAVVDVESFLVFVGRLRVDRDREVAAGGLDRFGRGPRGWENHTIEAFLEAAIAWAGDGRRLKAAGSPWTAAAQFLHAGKFYE